MEFPRGKTSTWVTLHILKWLRIEFRRGKTSIRRHPEIITTWGFRMLLRIKYFLGNTSIWATLGPRNWATWRSWAAFLASDDLGLKFSLEETQFWVTPGFATLEAPWRLRLRLRRDIFPSWLGYLTIAWEFQDRPEITKSFGHVFNPSTLGNPEWQEIFKSF